MQALHLLFNHWQHAFTNHFQLLGGLEFAGHGLNVLDLQHFLQTRNPHHKEFVEVTVEDGKEL